MKQYSNIVTFTEETADAILYMLQRFGPEVAFDYMMQFKCGEYGFTGTDRWYTTGDEVYQKGEYIMLYNFNLKCINLAKVEEMEESE